MTKKFFFLQFPVAITWVNAAESQFPKAGKTATIFCEVTANPAPTVDWLRNGDPVSNPSQCLHTIKASNFMTIISHINKQASMRQSIFRFVLHHFNHFTLSQIKSGGRYAVDARGLLIRDIDQNDDGIYTCRAAVIQTGELVERNIRVEVHIPPKVIALPKVLEAIEEQQFSVQCNATGKPVPEFTWIKDHSQVNVEHADR